MIEIWRQCVLAVGTSPIAAGYEYMSVGALRAGGELREVRLWGTTTASAATEFYLALSGTPIADATSFRAASPLMEGPSAYRHLGKPGWLQTVYASGAGERFFSFAVRVESGSRWLHVAWLRSETRPICVTASVTVIGYARTGANGLGVEDGLDK